VVRLIILFSLTVSSLSPSLAVPVPDVTWSKFDEYSRLSEREEQERLKNLGIQLNNSEESVVYVVVYGGQRVLC